MLGDLKLAIASAILVIVTFPTHAAPFGVPQAEIAQFCQERGPGLHLATFFMDDGLRLRGHVNCEKVTFTLSMVLPPLE